MTLNEHPKLLIFIVAYNAESHIETVLQRIPQEIRDQSLYQTRVLIIDDASVDKTVEASDRFRAANNDLDIVICKNPVNQGYGGNQKLGFHYAIEHGYDIVALLHGDGQYAPEVLPQLISPIAHGEADVVFGSRMLHKKDALKGGMPFYKFVGNIVLTKLQNGMLHSHLSEFHSGYRIYSTRALKNIPFRYNANGFSFDTDIIIQLIDTGMQIRELPIPTYYGNEICNVNGVLYAFEIVLATALSRLQRKAFVYYDPKFDYEKDNSYYTEKIGYPSSHQFAIDTCAAGSTVLDIGCGPGVVARELKKKGCAVYGYDRQILPEVRETLQGYRETNFDTDEFRFEGKKLDMVLMLDIIEHISDTEKFLLSIREEISGLGPRLVLTTGNVAFVMLRLSLLLGSFNYGKKGILDMTHKRLSTFKSLRRLLRNTGYVVEKVEGIPIPFPLVFGKNGFSNFLLWVNKLFIVFSKSLFSYQIAVVARPTPSLNVLLKDSIRHGKSVIAKAVVSGKKVGKKGYGV